MTYSDSMESYRSARGLAIAAVILVALQVALDALTGVGCALTMALPDGAAWLSLIATGIASILSALLYIGALVVFMCWVYRSVANLNALGSLNFMKPSSAVWGFFIPFVNMVRPHQVMATVWSESQPAVLNEFGYALRRRTTVVTSWWALVVISTVFSRIVMRVVDEPATLAGLRRLAAWGMVESALWTVTGVLFIFMVWLTQRRQDEQWLDLERRRSVPQPTADVLR
jgi:uncharacterized protein DUF4328